MPTASLVSLDDIRAARARLEGVARRTPVLPVSSETGWRHLLVKCENLQATGAFKLRGAYNLISQIDPDVRARGVVTYSSGNHGQAVAWAAARFSIPAIVVMPTTAPAVKVDGTRAYGAEVQFAGTTSLHRMAAAEALQRERGLTMVPPFDDARIIAGQGTVGLELLEQMPDVTTVYVPMGGGGLASGVAEAIKASAPHVRVVGVEPAGAPKMTESLAAGHPVTLAHVGVDRRWPACRAARRPDVRARARAHRRSGARQRGRDRRRGPLPRPAHEDGGRAERRHQRRRRSTPRTSWRHRRARGRRQRRERRAECVCSIRGRCSSQA